MNKILVIGAHPDDIEFGCGGIIIAETRKGSQVKNLVLSRGEAGTNGTPESREQESRAAAKLAGADIAFLDFGGDSHLTYKPENSIKLAGEIRAFQPDILLAPLIESNQHPDHTAVGLLARDASRLARYGGLAELKDLAPHRIKNLFFYAITRTTSRNPEIIIDVSEVAGDWKKAIETHQSQMKTREYSEFIMVRARALGVSVGVDYAIGLWLHDPVLLTSISDLGLPMRSF